MPKVRLDKYCCQGGYRVVITEQVKQEDLILAQHKDRVLIFSPLGNKPKEPTIALVGITPGSQMLDFVKRIRYQSIETAAAKAAFAGAQSVIKELLSAHEFARHVGLNLDGDINANDQILTTSLVKCCLMVNGSYKFKAPDILTTPEALHCMTQRFIKDVDAHPSLKWAVIFGCPGWEAVKARIHEGKSVHDALEARGIQVIRLPHFAQNFQQRKLFALTESDCNDLLRVKPEYRPYAAKAAEMRASIIAAMSA